MGNISPIHFIGAGLSLAGVFLVGVAMFHAFAYIDDRLFAPNRNILIAAGILGPLLWAAGRFLRVHAAKKRKTSMGNQQ